MSSNYKISIVVATLGRESLKSCLESWLKQTKPVSEIVVVADGEEALGKTRVLLKELDLAFPKIKLLYNVDRQGVSSSFNEALQHANGDYVALTSDDDLWAPEKIEKQITFLENNNFDAVLTGAFYRRKRKWLKRPKKPLNPKMDPLIQVFGNKTYFWSASMYIPMSSILFKKEMTKILFDTHLQGYEDFWWLHQAFLEGFRIAQIKEPLIYIDTDLARSGDRTKNVELNFVPKLQEINARLAYTFVLFHLTRSVIYKGDLRRLSELHALSRRLHKRNQLDYFDIFWQVLLASALKTVVGLKKGLR